MNAYDGYIGTVEPGVIQYENVNENRSYPFADDAVLETIDGRILPDNVIVDVRVVVPSEGSNKDKFLSSLYISKSMISACFYVLTSGNTRIALTVTVHRDSFVPYMPYRLEQINNSSTYGSGGVITFGDIDFDSCAGSYRFNDGKAILSDSVVLFKEESRIRSIVDDRSDKKITGDVKIEFSSHVTARKEGRNVELGISQASNDILLSDCDKNRSRTPCGATPITSINGVLPDEKRRLVIWFH